MFNSSTKTFTVTKRRTKSRGLVALVFAAIASVLGFIVGTLAKIAFKLTRFTFSSWIYAPAEMVRDSYKSRHARHFWLTLTSGVVWLGSLALGVALLHLYFDQLRLETIAICVIGLGLLPRTWPILFRSFLELNRPLERGDEFYRSRKWRELRYEILRERGAVCELCGSIEAPLHVDHIRPRSKYPQLALDRKNLQVLCEACNLGKGVRYEDDFRAS